MDKHLVYMTSEQRAALRDQNPALLKQIERNDTNFLNTIYVLVGKTKGVLTPTTHLDSLLGRTFYYSFEAAEKELKKLRSDNPLLTFCAVQMHD